MSESRLRSYLRKADTTSPTGHVRLLPVVFTDSKGYSLENNINVNFDRNIRWWCESGAKIEDRYNWLKRELPTHLYNLGDIALYIWLGTCDLTTKNEDTGFINLTSTGNASTDHVINYLEKFKTYLDDNQHVHLTFLEIPVYSIKAYNESKGHQNPILLKAEDRTLAEQVIEVNRKIRQLNNDLNTHSPDFSVFLKANSRHRTRSHVSTVQYYNYKLYRDGIHPGQLLARAWLREIAKRVKLDCWT